jgi:ubiquinone/menaquinone biosynthesis C-methylase UbiE
MESELSEGITEQLKLYWQGQNIPQRWYSNKEPLTLQWFNEIAHKRYQHYYAYLREHAEFMDHSGEDILEIGVGLGTDLVEYAKGGARVYGMDLGEEQVNLARMNFELRGLEYCALMAQDATDIQYPDACFDLVYSFGVLHHIPNTQKAVDEVHRILKEDGQAIIMLYARGWKHYIKRCFIQGLLRGKYFKLKSWQAVYNDASEVNGGSPHTAVFTRRQVKKLFKSFAHVEIKKQRLGEFFDYKPYGTMMLPKWVSRLCYACGLDALLGENYFIKAYKAPKPKKTPLRHVLFKHY